MVIDDVAFTIEQTEEQAKLKIVRLGYAYTVRIPDRTLYRTYIDILGDDVVLDDKLALGVDHHEVACTAGRDERVERSLFVGQNLLDEDVGTDEIKLKITITTDDDRSVSVMTPVIRGDF